jgi:ADP-ribosylglycohydrolase
MENKVKAGIMGVCIGDALGVPVEFKRGVFKKFPVTKMQELCHGISLREPGVMTVL